MSQNTSIAKTGGAAGLKAILAQPAYAKRFEEIMGKRAPQFMASMLSVAGTLPENTDPMTIVTSAIIAATLDLPINKDLGFAWIVPYNGQAQFQMGYKGFIQLALRSSQYERMNARAINAEALAGFDEIGEPKIDWTKLDESKEAVGYVVAWKLVNGFTKVCYWSKKRVETHARRYSQAYAKGRQTPWTTHFDQMALKTVIKNELSDWGIMSVEMRQAQKFDQGIVIDVDSETVQYPDHGANDDKFIPLKPVSAKPVSAVEAAAAAVLSKTVQDERAKRLQREPEQPSSGVVIAPAAEPESEAEPELPGTSDEQAERAAGLAPRPATAPAPAKAPAIPSPIPAPATEEKIAALEQWCATNEVPEEKLCAWAAGKFRISATDSVRAMSDFAPRKVAQIIDNMDVVLPNETASYSDQIKLYAGGVA